MSYFGCGSFSQEGSRPSIRPRPIKNASRARFYSRPGNDLAYRFPLIVQTLARLRLRSCIIDGEAVACDDDGVSSFNLVRYRHHDEGVFLYAFDLIELNGDDLPRDPLEGRKATLEMVLTKAGPGSKRRAPSKAFLDLALIRFLLVILMIVKEASYLCDAWSAQVRPPVSVPRAQRAHCLAGHIGFEVRRETGKGVGGASPLR